MFKKTAFAIAAAATLGLSAVAVSTPAEAGFWYRGVFVEQGNWHNYHCHWENRQVTVWRHGFPRVINEQVKVCID